MIEEHRAGVDLERRDAPARPRHSGHFGDGLAGCLDVLQNGLDPAHIESVIIERQRKSVAHHETHVESAAREASARLGDHRLADVDSNRMAAGAQTRG